MDIGIMCPRRFSPSSPAPASAWFIYTGKDSDPILSPCSPIDFTSIEFYQTLIAWTQDLAASFSAHL